jgi:hypothetical protein
MRILPKRDQIVQRHDLSFGLRVLCFVFLTYVYAKILRRIRPLHSVGVTCLLVIAYPKFP